MASIPVPLGSYYELLGGLHAADLNSTADQAIMVSGPKYIINQIIVTNASVTPTLAAGGLYTGASKAGAIVGSLQGYTGLTAPSKYINLTLLAVLTTDIRTENTLYFSLTTANGSACTGDLYIFGYVLP